MKEDTTIQGMTLDPSLVEVEAVVNEGATLLMGLHKGDDPAGSYTGIAGSSSLNSAELVGTPIQRPSL